MKNKILTLLAVSLFSLNVSAESTSKNPILIDSFSTSEVTVIKNTDSVNMNKKVGFNVNIYIEKADADATSNVGVYSKDSPQVSSLPKDKYTFKETAKIESYEGVTSSYSNNSIVPVNNSIEITSKKDGSIKTTFNPDSIVVGKSLTIDKVLDVVSVNISETNIQKWRKYKSEFGVIDLPSLFKWTTSQKVKVKFGQILRIDSPLYVKNSETLRTVYLIEPLEIK